MRKARTPPTTLYRRLRKWGFSATNRLSKPPGDAQAIAPGLPRPVDLVAEIPANGRWHGEKTPGSPRLFHLRGGPGAGGRGSFLPGAHGHEG